MKKIYTLVGLLAISAANAQVSDLGSFVQVTDISNAGVAVGNVDGGAFFMWSEQDSGEIIGIAGSNGVSGNANISADGSVISMSLPNPSNNNVEEAVLYTVGNGNLNYLGYLGVIAGGDTSSAWGMSSDGKSIVGFAWNTAAKGEAVLWKNGAPIVGLGSTVATRSSRANGVSSDGSIVVGWQDSNVGVRQGAVWTNGV